LAQPAWPLQSVGMEGDATTTNLDWNAIEEILPAGWRPLASEMKLVRSRSAIRVLDAT